MNEMLAPNYSFRITAQDKVQVDPQLILQRLVIACDESQLEELFQCELYTYPIALFDSPFMLRQPQKSAQADAL